MKSKTSGWYGSIAIVHRKFAPPFFPVAEAGPAVIVNAHPLHASDAECYLSKISGFKTIGYSAGAIPHVGSRVAILSCAVPGSERYIEAPKYPWFLWEAGKPFPKRKLARFDTIIVYRPKEIFPRLTVSNAAEHILSIICGGGATYTVDSIERLKEAAKKGVRQS